MNTHEQLIPISHLSLDLSEPVAGWEQVLTERGVEIVLDDLGRPSVRRAVVGELIAERREHEARLLEDERRRRAEHDDRIPAGVPAIPGQTPFESLVAAGGVVTPEQEFGQRPKPNFLEEELAAGQRHIAEQRAEAELLKKAQRVLDGRADQ